MDNINLENKEALQQKLETLRAKDGFICDMDGVIYHGNRLLPGVKEFVDWLYRENKHFLFLTNSSERSPKELQQKLGRMGLDVDESHFYTSALATARFISSQAPGCSAYVIGGAGLIMALHDEGITMNDVDPDYVIIGEGNSYNYENILKAVRLVLKGAKLYVALFPCNECAKAIIQSGIREVIYLSDKYADTDNVRASKRMLHSAGVTYRQLDTQLEEIRLSFSVDAG